MQVSSRRIGGYGFEVGAIGLGCMPMTGVYDVEHRNDERAEATVHRALNLGITLLDTADSYGPLANEILLGRTLRRRRDEVVLVGKVGLIGAVDRRPRVDASPAHIRFAVEGTLKRLHTDHLDICQLQAVDPAVPVEESWGTFTELVHEGKVRSLGVVTSNRRLLSRLQQLFPITLVSAPLSLVERHNLEVARWAADRGIGFAATRPLNRGFLTGEMAPTRPFSDSDLRSRLSEFTPDSLRSRHQVIDRLRAVARQRAATPTQVAIAWLLAQSDTVIPLPGTRRPDHLDEIAGAADLVLTPEELDLLDQHPVAQEDPAPVPRADARTWTAPTPAELPQQGEPAEILDVAGPAPILDATDSAAGIDSEANPAADSADEAESGPAAAVRGLGPVA